MERGGRGGEDGRGEGRGGEGGEERERRGEGRREGKEVSTWLGMTD